MAIQGLFASHLTAQADNMGTISNRVLRLGYNAQAPLLGFAAGIKQTTVSKQHHTFFEDAPGTNRANVVNNAGTGTSLQFDDASEMLPTSVLLNAATGEYIYIDSVSGNVATVVRGIGNTTIVAIDGSGTPVELQRITNASEEASERPSSVAHIDTPRSQSVQTFRNGWDVSGIMRATTLETTNDVASRNKQEAAVQQAQDIENSFFWGPGGVLRRNGKLLYMATGLKGQISSNIYTEAAGTTWGELTDFIGDVNYRQIKGQPNERICFGGWGPLGVINSLADTKSQKKLDTTQKVFGWDVNTVTTYKGSLKYITHPAFVEKPAFQNSAIVLHPAALEIIKIREGEQDNYDKSGSRGGKDADYGIITSDMAIILRAEQCSGYIQSMHTAA